MEDTSLKLLKITLALPLTEEVPKSQIHTSQGNASGKQHSVPFLLPEESPISFLEKKTVSDL